MSFLKKLNGYLFGLIVYLFICRTNACTSEDEVNPNVPTRLTKNGFITVELKETIAVLSIIRDYDPPISLYLRTRKNNELLQSSFIDCGLNKICLHDDNGLNHTIIEASTDTEIIKITRLVDNKIGKISDCVELKEDTQWVGGPQFRRQHWPIQHMYFKEEAYIPTHPENMAITERYWLSSKGFYILASEKDPLFLDQNNYKDKGLCLVAKNKEPYTTRDSITLNYEVGLFENSREAHEYVVENRFGKPIDHPDTKMVYNPIWSTWAKYKMNIDETLVSEFADQIVAHGYNNSQIEIDDNWETCYGSAEFDRTKFPNIEQLIVQLKSKGFRVTLWIHPFINKDCTTAYQTALNNKYFVQDANGNVETTWWQGEKGAGVIDFTNTGAVAWWVSRLKKLQLLGIDSFKFDAGETSWLPKGAKLTGASELQPGIFTTKYVSALAENFNQIIEARVALQTQKLPIFIRMIDKDSDWTWNNGIPTLITTLLQMNINGYPFVLPDMVGGNGYAEEISSEENLASSIPPSKELFIRWLQANVFMPSIQYSFVPWDYDGQTDEICKEYTKMHTELAPKIVSLMEATVKSGSPINPPIWWVDPTNPLAYEINDEYLLGEEYLIAPVIEEGAITRDIYLPRGIWKDGRNDATHTGPVWLKDYPAPLDVLPYFKKIS